MKARGRWQAWLFALALFFVQGSSWAQNVEILHREVDEQGQGITVMRVWGTHEEMGFAMGATLADEIIEGVEEARLLGGIYYSSLRGMMDEMLWQPVEVEDELIGMLAGIQSLYPQANVDVLDLKVLNTFGDWGYYGGCRSHACWGDYTTDGVRSLATRRLDFGTGYDIIKQHVLCAWEPSDGSPRWVNMAWPGYVAVVTGVNEYGTLVSLHDYASDFVPEAGSLPRCVATRLVLTGMDEQPLAGHLSWAEDLLTATPVATGTFINYYAPEGLGGVFTCPAGEVCSVARRPQADYYDGQVMMTTNSQTDGHTTPYGGDFMADYYDLGAPKTIEDHFWVMGHSMHLLTVAYRGRGDMEFLLEGHTDNGPTSVVSVEWSDLFPGQVEVDAGTRLDAGTEADAGGGGDAGTELDAGDAGDAGTEVDAGGDADEGGEGGCACSSSAASCSSAWFLLVGFLFCWRRRRNN